MKRLISILSVVLAAQVALAALLYWRASAPPVSQSETLVSLQPEQIDGIEITGADGTVKLARRGTGWVMPGYHDLPVSADAITRTLERFKKLEGGAPVTTQPSAHARFKVAQDSHERLVVLKQGDKVLSRLYIGTSASRGRTHARLEGEAAVREIGLAAYDVPVAPTEWLDKSFLATPAGDITAITLGDLRLTRAAQPKDGAVWEATGLPPGKSLKQDAVNKLVDAIAGQMVGKVLDTKVEPEYGLGTPAVALTVLRKNAPPREYKLGVAGKDDNTFALQVSGNPLVFHLDGLQARGLMEAGQPQALLQ